MQVRGIFMQYSNQVCKMKSFVVLCVALVAGIHAANVTLPPKQLDKAQQNAAECVKETGVSSEVLAEAKKGHFTEDEGLKKFTFCFFKKAGIIDGDAKLNIEEAIAKLPPGVDKDNARKVLESCKSKSGKTKEETAFEILKCYREGVHDHVVLGL